MEERPLIEELETARELALRAGASAMKFHGREITIETKPEGEPVTIADQEANAIIVDGLGRAFPDDAILAEETPDDQKRLDHARVWMVDPIDGTRDFIRGSNGFSVMIGLAIAGRPVLGVVFQPIGEKLYWGTAGGGAWLAVGKESPRPIHVSEHADLSRIRLVASKSHRTPFIDEVRQLLGITDELNIGSVGLKLGLIATGGRDLYINPSSKSSAWDTCAPEAILTAAGGRLTDLRGQPLRYDRAEVRNLDGLLASNGALHEPVLERLRPLIESPSRAD